MKTNWKDRISHITLAFVLLTLTACGAAPVSLPPSATPALVAVGSLVPTETLFPSATPSPSASPSPSPTITLTPTITPTPEPHGCQAPVEDYTRVEINGWTINQRTLTMLQHASELYGGELEITGHHITQGSYNNAEPASFGTHDGGGAVDLSVMRKGTYTILWDEVEPLIWAMRAAGFAAWLREYGELYEGSPYHIHAIAIGDRDLSPAAIDQLTGKFGYFRGYTGVPIPDGAPIPDRHGGPILCQWMIDMGYADLRAQETQE